MKNGKQEVNSGLVDDDDDDIGVVDDDVLVALNFEALRKASGRVVENFAFYSLRLIDF